MSNFVRKLWPTISYNKSFCMEVTEVWKTHTLKEIWYLEVAENRCRQLMPSCWCCEHTVLVHCSVERLACSTAAFQRCAMRLWLSLTSNTLQHPLYRLHAPMLAPRDCCKVKRPGKVIHDTAIAYPPPSYPTTQHQPTNESNTILQLTPVLSHK